MGTGAEGNTLRNFLGDAEPLAEIGAEHIAQDAGDDNGQGGNGGRAAVKLCQSHADGGCDALGQQRNGEALIVAKNQGQCQYHAQTADRTGGHAQSRDQGLLSCVITVCSSA